jgi:hypothetical protein
VLLDFDAPGKIRLPVGQEHGRTIPLADLGSGRNRDLFDHLVGAGEE